MFTNLRSEVQKQFAQLAKNANVLFVVDCERSKFFEVYLNNFDKSLQQENNCNCCRSFLKEIGGVVSVVDGQLKTVWDFEPKDEEYKKPVAALREFVKTQKIKNVYYSESKSVGVESNYDKKRMIAWDHFYLTIPNNFVKKDAGETLSGFEADKGVLERSVKELTEEAVDTVIELINQGSLYRGSEYLATVQKFKKFIEQYKKVAAKNKDYFLWEQSRILGSAVARIKNSAIGTLLENLSKGEELDGAVRKFESVVAPANYKRPKALVTPKMIEAAKKELEEKGLLGALKRRQLTTRDLNVNNAIFVHRSSGGGDIDVFQTLTKEATVNPKKLSKVEEISIDDFLEKVVPTAKSINALVENEHFGNFVSLAGPQDQDEKNMFKWNNNVSWSYSGEVADSIKQRVKNAGGNVTGKLRVSLAWSNFDDLDLHIIEPNGYEIEFRNKRKLSPSGGMLDVDMNAGVGTSRNPVENITWMVDPTIFGEYIIFVNNWSKRESKDTGFTVEVEYNGELHTFAINDNGPSSRNHEIAKFTYNKSGFSINGKTNSSYNSQEKWGVKTGQWTKVKAITLSPNYWDNKVGNKHFMFFLDKCIADEKIRPFYNEFLNEELLKNKKVFELLGGKLDVEKPSDELSGLGFSETVRNHLFVEVEGKFKRTLKVNF